MKIIVSNGEIVDKLSILVLKEKNMKDPEKLKNVRVELSALSDAVRLIRSDLSVPDCARFDEAATDLADTNFHLWRVEDMLREKERAKDFGEEFVNLARSVYKLNDRRATIKKAINAITRSTIVEEKSYEKYE